MHNPVVATASFGRVYQRKIDVFREANKLDGYSGWVYVWSTNSCRTCRDAVSKAEAKHPEVKFKAVFAK